MSKPDKLVVPIVPGEFEQEDGCRFAPLRKKSMSDKVKPEPSVEMRERFEQWCESVLPHTALARRYDGLYADHLIERLWKAWHAGASYECMYLGTGR